MNHVEKAEELFRTGYNCAQAVFCAFTDVTGLELGTAARIASSFGGGIGRMREVCGAVSGALMVLGMEKGYSDVSDPAAKREHYAMVQEFARRFKDERGSIICRELLENVKTSPGPVPEARTSAYYDRRPCVWSVRTAAALTDEFLQKEA